MHCFAFYDAQAHQTGQGCGSAGENESQTQKKGFLQARAPEEKEAEAVKETELGRTFLDETNRNKTIRKTVNFADVFIDNVIIYA